jgi:DNA-binding beta-propeller fold protein YncE/mono/diheme cytochrome c family protein
MLVRGPTGDVLFLADEDRKVVRRIDLPVDASAPSRAFDVPGRPAQVIALPAGAGGRPRIAVTVRDPGLLIGFEADEKGDLKEVARVALPSDAWGLALSPDGKTLLVTSAWTHAVSAVDAERWAKRWTIDLPSREPRGVVVAADGKHAYVSHLVGGAITRLDDIDGDGPPRVSRVDLPPAPARSPSGKTLDASLGYSAVMNPEGTRLFVARHALGALGAAAWFGAGTVDVLVTAHDAPAIRRRVGHLPSQQHEIVDEMVKNGEIEDADPTVPKSLLSPFVQPRAIVYRKATRTLLVVGEGSDNLVELDGESAAPALQPLMSFPVGGDYNTVGEIGLGIARSCGAPSGLALSSDERLAYVFCRATGDVAVVKLSPHKGASGQQLPAPIASASAAPSASASAPPALPNGKKPKPPSLRDETVAVFHLAADPLSKDAAMGRRFFYGGRDAVSSGGEGPGMGCAGCHPDGRDDGHVWHEAKIERTRFREKDHMTVFIGEADEAPDAEHGKSGYPRQTPMLAGRVDSPGPYGWHAQNVDLVARLREGFTLHRWGHLDTTEEAWVRVRAQYLRAFLREGLVPPARDAHAPTPQEQRGEAIFTSEEARCSKCHVPQPEYTDRMAYPFAKQPALPGFEDEDKLEFKTPSLRFVGGTAPYFHDGREPTLEALVEHNRDRMGKTSHLSKDDRAALVAFLRTL